MNRLARTRSENLARHPACGLPQWSVGSIDGDGMRYGLTTYALTSRTIATAATIVTTQSTAIRQRRGSRDSSLHLYIDGGCCPGYRGAGGSPRQQPAPIHRWSTYRISMYAAGVVLRPSRSAP